MSETVKCCREWEVAPSELGGVTLTYERDGCTWQIRTGMHCMWCGARFRLREDGTVEVGPSVEKLLVALYREMNSRRSHLRDDVAVWALICYGLAITYAEAVALWKRMEEAAHAG